MVHDDAIAAAASGANMSLPTAGLAASAAATALVALATVPRPVRAVLCAASLAATTLALQRFQRRWQHRSQLHQVLQLLAHAERFDTALRQKIRYMREVQCLCAAASAGSVSLATQQRQHELAAACTATVAATLPVIWTTFAAVQRVERLPLSEALAAVYLPTESLDNCELLRRSAAADDDGGGGDVQYSVQDVRDALEICQFLQSQLLLRLGLATVCNPLAAPRLLRTDVPDLCAVIAAQLRTFATADAVRAQRDAVRERLAAARSARHGQPIEADRLAVRALQCDSGAVLARVLALADELHGIDGRLQAVQSVLEASAAALAADVDRLGDRFDACREELRRLQCTFGRAVMGGAEPMAKLTMADRIEPPPSVDRVFDEDVVAERSEAEFYALAERDDDDDDNASDDGAPPTAQSLHDELQQLNAHIVKRQFRPVLRQLRDRLEPINEAMRRRERDFLAAQGIEADDETPGNGEANSDDDDVNNDGRRPPRKDAYADRRQFLQDKRPIGFGAPLMAGFPLPPQRAMLDEEILE